MKPPGPAHDSASADRPDTDDLVERFDEAWRKGQPPRMDDFLPPPSPHGPAGDPRRRRLLEELVPIDLEHHWRRAAVEARSQLPRLEDYVARYPELGPLDRLPVELIAYEYRARQCWGDRPSHAEYAARFTRQAPA